MQLDEITTRMIPRLYKKAPKKLKERIQNQQKK
jgi:hypothetical protein